MIMGIATTRVIAGVISAFLFVAAAPERKLTDAQLHNVLWCIQRKGPEVGAPLPHFDKESVRFRYQDGLHSFEFGGHTMTVGKDGEVELGVYGPREHTLTIYDIFLAEEGDKTIVSLGHPSSFS